MATVQFYTKNFAGSFSQLSTSAKNSAVGIFSLKALFVSPARVLNVRNGTNSSTSDIYADVNGNLTTGAGQTLSAWLSGATGYITTWYDQSPVGNHATQVVQASQPIIDFANNQVDFKTSAWFDLPNGTVPSGNSNYTMTFKNNTIGSAAAIIHSGTQGTQNFVNAIEVNSGGYLNFWWANDIGGGAAATGTIVTAKYDNTVGRRMYKNGTQTNSDTQTTRSSTTINNFIAKDPRSYYLNGELYYICLFNTALSDADRSIVENQPAAPPAPLFYMSMTIGSPAPLFNSLSAGAVSSASGIFSLYAIKGTNPIVVDIRRGSDNAINGFFGSTNGTLFSGAGGTGTSLVDFLGGSTGYVYQWRDQSGNGNHMSCSSSAIQPIIDIPNMRIDFKPGAYFDVSANPTSGPVPYLNSQNYTVMCRHNSIQNNAGGLCGCADATGGNNNNYTNNFRANLGGAAGLQYYNYWFNNDLNAGTYAIGNKVTWKWDGTNRYMYTNGTLNATQASSGWLQTTSANQLIGKTTADATMNGEMYSLYCFKSALSDPDRIILETGYVTVSPVSIRIFGLPPLYPFTTFTFTPMTATGASGPGAITYGASTPGYGTTSVMSLSGGIQYWTVPKSGNYTFTIAGACGGAGGSATRGLGAVITVTLPLTQSDVVKLLVGQMGTSAVSGCPVTKGGGGGGSFVYNNTTSTILLVAGGGAGGAGGPIVTAGKADASLTTAGNAGDGTNGGAGGTSASGGIGGVSACGNSAGGNGGGGGGGYSGNGTNGSFAPSNLGQSFLNGGVGGSNTAEGTTYGGFGGGGAAGHHAGGGGGGYSGGGGGGLQTCSCADTQRGGGGGSYATVSFTSSAVTNAGDGYITITKV